MCETAHHRVARSEKTRRRIDSPALSLASARTSRECQSRSLTLSRIVERLSFRASLSSSLGYHHHILTWTFLYAAAAAVFRTSMLDAPRRRHFCFLNVAAAGTTTPQQQQQQRTTNNILVGAVAARAKSETMSSSTFSSQTEKNIEFICKSFLAGGIAGMCSKTTVAPLDRIKILLQAHSHHYKHLGVFSGLREIIHREHFFALYKGNFAQMVRIFPYAATQFTAFEIYKKYLGNLLGNRTQADKFIAGSCAGVTAVALTYPLDTIRARLAFQVTGEHIYTGIIHTAVSIFKDEGGFRALYRGFIPTVCGMIPYAGFSFYSFEKFKYLCMKYFPTVLCNKCEKNTGGLVLTIPGKLLCGGVAGAVAQSFSYPLDVTRRRMQLAMMNPDTYKFGTGMVSTLRMVYQENGIVKGLYRGMSINYLRAIPMVAMSFATYEVMKQLLNLDTGLKIAT